MGAHKCVVFFYGTYEDAWQFLVKNPAWMSFSLYFKGTYYVLFRCWSRAILESPVHFNKAYWPPPPQSSIQWSFTDHNTHANVSCVCFWHCRSCTAAKLWSNQTKENVKTLSQCLLHKSIYCKSIIPVCSLNYWQQVSGSSLSHGTQLSLMLLLKLQPAWCIRMKLEIMTCL